jgi:RNA polymerase sigma-70 factor (ECF subfamily)
MKRSYEVIKWNDVMIAQGLSEGSTEAYRELADRYSGLIYEYCIEQCGCRQEALDILNEVLIRIVIVIGQYDADRASLATWVVNITRNYLIDHFRKKKDEPEILEWSNEVFDLYPDLRGNSYVPEYLEDEDDEDEVDEDIVILRKAMEGLSERDRDLLRLRADGISYDEICGYYDISKSAARNAVFKATKRVKERFAAGCLDTPGLF